VLSLTEVSGISVSNVVGNHAQVMKRVVKERADGKRLMLVVKTGESEVLGAEPITGQSSSPWGIASTH